MLITRKLGDCPKCKTANTYGNCNVFGHELLRGCEACDYKERYFLPDLRKDILYLDQFFFSHAFHGKDAQFIDAEERLKKAAHEQLLAAPFSSLHEEEAVLYKDRKELREFIRSTSRGHKFAPQYQVERTQVFKAFSAWRKGEPPEYIREERDVLDRDIHDWDGYFTIDVWGGFRHDPEVVRQSKLQSVEQLVGIFDGWRNDTTTFAQDVEAELLAAAQAYVSAYAEMVARAIAGDLMAVADTPIRATVVEGMMIGLGREADPKERLKTIGDFLKSAHFKSTPFQRLSSLMFATLKAMVKNGAYRNVEEAKNKKLRGFFYDVNHIATYAPYCSAILIDSPMAALVSDPKVALEGIYGTKIFSRRNWDAFLGWMDGLQAKKTLEHTKALELIHASKS